MKLIKYTVIIMLLSLSTVFAITSFNFNTGQGFVPEADIRAAYNWNNMNPNRINSLSFAAYSLDRYSCVCSTPGGNFNQFRQSRSYRQLFRTPTYNGNNFTGMSLNGYSYIAQEQVPYVGQNCNQSYWQGTFSSVTLASHAAQLYMITSASTTRPSSQQIWGE